MKKTILYGILLLLIGISPVYAGYAWGEIPDVDAVTSDSIAVLNAGITADDGIVEIIPDGTDWTAGFGPSSTTFRTVVLSSQVCGTLITSYGYNSSSATEITAVGQAESIKSTTVAPTTMCSHFDSPGNGKLRYTGKHGMFIDISANNSLNLISGSAAVAETRLYKNDTWIDGIRNYGYIYNSGDWSSIPLFGTIWMEPNDYVSVWVINRSNTDNIGTMAGQIKASAPK